MTRKRRRHPPGSAETGEATRDDDMSRSGGFVGIVAREIAELAISCTAGAHGRTLTPAAIAEKGIRNLIDAANHSQ